ncbi:MAG: YceI family protein [Ktedonobacteraceae bacterium]|nr:YceI family protein [Ktedonobacteraceae bacterium]
MAWEIDPMHSTVEFSVRHLMINTVKGHFPNVRGTIHLDTKYPELSWVKAQVEAASISTFAPQRDAHLRSADFFEVARYPTITFESTLIKPVSPNRCYLNGNLSLHGQTRPVTFAVEYTGHNRDMYTDAWRIGLSAVTVIDRRQFGITYNPEYVGGGLIIGNEVRIEIHVEAVQS